MYKDNKDHNKMTGSREITGDTRRKSVHPSALFFAKRADRLTLVCLFAIVFAIIFVNVCLWEGLPIKRS